ncbi:MAG: trigger factor [Candidatus Sungbacteria bacterium RIFCSPHIGHO2_02_FULL_47_11]|uniref:Trigger factor n=1 Tax=Candidatus Sungbacteria bacterium RIFCSPHIGHO2_02_FULL_47_11 TaxID=1802270 RepID=A0A1G2KKE5_9BACT|nr:MAG: trigger factor [Candidatus Sungbacteria bacterium RIFCSPHIGHO2_02_FULL_47_11]
MQYNLQTRPRSEVEIEVVVPFSEFEPHVKRAAVLISEETEIKGFRKGKAPYEKVKEAAGEAAIYERAADVAVRKTCQKVMEELVTSNQLPASRPPIGKPEITVTKLAPANEFQYKIKLALLPEVTLPDYKTIARRVQKEKKDVAVSDEEVAQTIEWLRNSRAPLVTVDRPAEKDDSVEIDFEVRHGGVKLEGGDSKNHPLVIGKNKFMPGFEDNLIGMKAREEKTFSLVAPEGWHEKALAGKELEFKTAMRLVQERHLMEVNDDFAKTLGNFESLEALQGNIRNGLMKEKGEKETQRVRSLIIEEVAKNAKMEIPEALVSSELEKMTVDFRSNIEQMGMRWEDYLTHIKKSFEDLKKEWRPEAEKRVRIALCLREIAEKEKIEASEEEVKARADEFLRQFRSVADAEKKIDLDQLLEYTRGIVRNEKVFEFLEKV